MKGIIGTSMNGREYYKRPDKIKSNCKRCGHCKQYDKAHDGILCGKWNEWKYGNDYKNKRLCRWFYTFPDKKHGSECTIDGNIVRFLNKNLHFHVYRRKLPDVKWEYIGKVYACKEAEAINKAIQGKQFKHMRQRGGEYEYKAEIHNEDIEQIQTFGENSIPKVIWKKKSEGT